MSSCILKQQSLSLLVVTECNHYTHITYICNYIYTTDYYYIYSNIYYVCFLCFCWFWLIFVVFMHCHYNIRIFWFILMFLMGNSASFYSHKYFYSEMMFHLLMLFQKRHSYCKLMEILKPKMIKLVFCQECVYVYACKGSEGVLNNKHPNDPKYHKRHQAVYIIMHIQVKAWFIM